jgi:hypothetical protein
MVQHKTPAGETKELTYDLNSVEFPNDLWLAEGDIIVIPAKAGQ